MITYPTQWMGVAESAGNAVLGQTVFDMALTWNREIPYAVEIRFVLDPEEPEAYLCWEVGRDLLARGAASWAGEGDVQVAVWAADPALAVVSLYDAVDGRWGRFLARRADLTAFLTETYRQVPAGQEHLDLDAALADLVGGEDR